jgi:general secretion pathway protein D
MTLRFARLWFALGLLALVPGAFAQAQVAPVRPAPPIVATPVPKNDPDMVDSFKVSDVDIDAILGALETNTGRTVVRPGQLPTASYSLKITRPIPRAELVTALETLLALNGVAVFPMGDRFLKVMALPQAKSEAPEMIVGSSLDLPPSGRIVTKLFELNFLRVSEFVPQIQSFMTPGIGGGIVQLEKSNVALVTDSLENIQKIERLLEVVDKPRKDSLTPIFYSVHNAKASDLVTKIHSMLAGAAQNQLRATTTFTADDRTNQIVVIADPREYPLFDTLIKQLDIQSDLFTRTEVMLLKHADAKDVATLLSAIISGQTSAAQKISSTSVRPGQVAQLPGQPPPAPNVPQPAVSNTISEVAGPGSTEFSDRVTIQPDERTNAVVVSGDVNDLRLIRDIVDKVDVLLAQVSIEVVIAEVTLSDTDNTGLNALGLTFGKAPNGGFSITGFTGAVAGASIGASPTVTGAVTGITNPLSFLATMTSAGDKHKVKILQQDTITTTHNKQAQFVVSTKVPIITGTTSVPLASTTEASPFSTSSQVTYTDIGITLKVTPLIGDDGSIQLTIDQIVDDNQGSVMIDGNSQPIIGHREAQSFINVMDGQMAVLGGLQSSGLTSDRQKIGFLYEIPIISNLLGYRMRDLERTELLLFIRPHVIRPEEFTGNTQGLINGMSNKEQINKYLKNPDKMPDPKDTLKDKFE